MDADLTEKLRAKHPTFFAGLYGDPTKTCMAWGLECGDGWYALLEKLCDDIAVADPPENFRFAQIKEKFGGLRVYVDLGNDKIFALLDAVEEESYKVCEGCGSTENVTSEGAWIVTLCKNCRGKR